MMPAAGSGRLAGKEAAIATAYRGGRSTVLLGADYGVTPRLINHALEKAGESRRSQEAAGRRHEFEQGLMERIDAPEKAYILGLLYADGCNYRNPETREFRVSLDLKETDRALVERVASEFGYGGPLRRTQQGMVGLRLKSRRLSDDLCKLGVIPEKSLLLDWPTSEMLPGEHRPHFVRGYFDGDGCIALHSMRKVKNYTVNIVGTKSFCQKLSAVLWVELCIRPSICEVGRKNGVTFCAKFNGNRQVNLFGEWIYRDASIWLQRKRDIFAEVPADAR